MDKTFNISVRDRLAKNLSHLDYVCGNTGYMVRFDFDEEWDAYPIKTARFIESSGEHHDVAVIDNQCEFPQIMNTIRVEAGVYAGDLYTTTPAVIGARRSILSAGGDRPAVPEDNEYDKMMEAINQDAVRAENAANEAETAAEEAKEAAEKAVGGGVVIVRVEPVDGVPKSSHTFRELQDLREDKVLLAIEGNRTYTYFGQEGMNLVFANMDYSGDQNNKSLSARRLVITSDDTVSVYSHNNVKAPNPNKLKFTGAASGEYDGSEEVTVEIPEGGGSVAAANADWGENDESSPSFVKNRTHYEVNRNNVIFEGSPDVIEDGAGIFMSRLGLEVGYKYTVNYNGVEYSCITEYLDIGGGMNCVAMGNVAAWKGSEPTEEPFLIFDVPVDMVEEAGMGAVVFIIDGSTELTLKIIDNGFIKKLDNKYLNLSNYTTKEDVMTLANEIQETYYTKEEIDAELEQPLFVAEGDSLVSISGMSDTGEISIEGYKEVVIQITIGNKATVNDRYKFWLKANIGYLCNQCIDNSIIAGKTTYAEARAFLIAPNRPRLEFIKPRTGAALSEIMTGLVVGLIPDAGFKFFRLTTESGENFPEESYYRIIGVKE